MDLLLLVILSVASNNLGLQAQSPETTTLLPETESLPTTPGCVYGDLRLEGGRTSSEGRVEICLNGEWGTVCDDSWDDDDSSVVCRQLGFSRGDAIAFFEAHFGEGTGVIWLDNVECLGTESILADCRAEPVGEHDCIHAEDAGVACELIPGFILFGEEVGDSIGPRADDNTTGSIRLSEPILYFEEEYYTFFVSTNGLLSFDGAFSDYMPCDLPCTPVPVIAPAWTDWTFEDSGTIYYGVAQDQVTLNQVVGMITDVNPELSDYQPTLAVIVTWFEARFYRNQSVVNTFQAVISTDGERSFVALLYTDPIVDVDIFIGFASAQREFADVGNTSLQRDSFWESTNIYRIDGPCITTVFPGDVCPLEADITVCNREDLSAIDCMCDEGFEYQRTRCIDIDECLLGFCGDNSQCFNTLGSFRCICNTGYVMDGPNNCVATDFVLFGEEVGDSIGPRADDRVTGSIRLSEPIVYFEEEYDTVFVSTNGLLSFNGAFSEVMPCDLPCTPVPVIAPAWTDWTFENNGTLYYGVAQDQVTLDQVVGMITEVNPELSDYMPTLALIVTWFEARLYRNQSVVNTFQAVISTDGERSFAALLYADPIVDVDLFIGFTSAEREFADVRNTSLQRGSFWESTNIYRIDGPCIITVFPGDVCPLEAVVAVCNHEDLSAINCTCDRGFKYQRTRCIDIDECLLGFCGDNSQCLNTLGSFRCICNTGYVIDGPNNCVATDFVLFGEEVGDSIGPRADDRVTGSIRLSEPIVYFEEEYDTVFVSTNGLLSFNGAFSEVMPCDLPCTPMPVIAPAWADWTFENNGTLYYRVAQDQVTLDQVVGMITEVNPELSDYMPTLALIVTWFEARLYRNQSVVNTFQAVISTDGERSFAALLYADPIVDVDHFIGFTSAQEEFADVRNTSLQRDSFWDSTNIYRIDGPCITTVFPGDVCPLEAVVAACDRANLSAIDCTCDEGFEFQRTRCIEINECLLGFCGDNSQCLNTLGSFRCICNTGYVMDGPNNCVATDFILFGVEAGDSIGPQGDDDVTRSIRLSEPILYLEREYYTFFVSTNGLLSFDEAVRDHTPCDLPCTRVPVIAPAWTDWTFLEDSTGTIYYRVAQDQVTLDEVVEMITEVNPELSDYLPTLAVIVTWFEARLYRNQSVVNTFQAVISTDGERSFAALLYADPIVDVDLFIGFTSAQKEFADVRNTWLQRGSFWESTNVYRIDGPCITTVFPGDVCPLEAVVAVCNRANLSAIDCTCDEGFEYQRTRCLDMNECDEDPSPCHQNSICSNSVGSFECTCEPGFTGDGVTCSEIDECLLEFCGDNSQCLNTLGSFRCICNTGYVMDGPNNCVATATSTSSSIIAAAVSIVIIVAVAIAVTVTVVIVVCLIRRKKHKERHDLLSARNEGLEPRENEYFQKLRQMSVQSSFNLKVSKSLLVNSCNLQLGKSIGQGEFGIVYKGLLKKGFTETYTETVAVKTLKGFLEKELVKGLLRECAKMKEFDHPNVLPLRGVCLDGGPAPYIIMPFMTNGSLHGYLRENRETLVIDQSSDDMVEVQKKLLDMCIQVAKGMEYLASKRLVHRDLAARNCMIDSGFVIKVADFGLSESMDITKEYFRQNKDDAIKLPIKWMAIESITDGIFSEKTDVWAYGVTCWEIFTGGKTPYPGIHPLELPNQLETGYRMEKPSNVACTQDMYIIVLNCWEKSPEGRPQFLELVSRLSAFLGSMADYFVFSNPAVPEESECDQEKTVSDTSINENVDEDTLF